MKALKRLSVIASMMLFCLASLGMRWRDQPQPEPKLPIADDATLALVEVARFEATTDTSTASFAPPAPRRRLASPTRLPSRWYSTDPSHIGDSLSSTRGSFRGFDLVQQPRQFIYRNSSRRGVHRVSVRPHPCTLNRRERQVRLARACSATTI